MLGLQRMIPNRSHRRLHGFLAYLLTRVPRADFPRRTAVAALAVLVLLIGFSRISLGAHYLSDVIGGYAAAAVWLTFSILVTDRTQRWGKNGPAIARLDSWVKSEAKENTWAKIVEKII